MYIPPFNRVEDSEKINAFIQAHGFATVVSDENANVLRSHMARANEQWKQFESTPEVLCIFHGPHAYISPSWYVMQHTVPTWNYAAVHVYGRPTIATADELKQIVYDTTTK